MERSSARDQFNRQAAHYNQQWNEWNRENLRWLLARAEPGARVLDVATGSGFTAIAFADTAREVVGVDVSQGMLAQARNNSAGRNNVSFQEAPAERLPFPDSSFDVVTCRVAAHHFPSVPAFAGEAYRVLAPGGKLLIADTCVPDDAPDLDAWQNEVELVRDPSHVRNYSPREWRSFLESAGFTVEEMTDQDGSVPITFDDWLKKAGCAGERAERARHLFTSAPPAARRIFHIQTLESGDLAFAWTRVLIAARKP